MTTSGRDVLARLAWYASPPVFYVAPYGDITRIISPPELSAQSAGNSLSYQQRRTPVFEKLAIDLKDFYKGITAFRASMTGCCRCGNGAGLFARRHQHCGLMMLGHHILDGMIGIGLVVALSG